MNLWESGDFGALLRFLTYILALPPQPDCELQTNSGRVCLAAISQFSAGFKVPLLVYLGRSWSDTSTAPLENLHLGGDMVEHNIFLKGNDAV